MKKFSILLIGILLLSGCSFNDDFSDKLIYTTSYPIEYATSMLYGDYGKISSVYPNGADTKYEVKIFILKVKNLSIQVLQTKDI